MNKILNFGSLNIDHVYTVPYFLVEGETLSSIQYQQHCGGKGLNQSVALANSGALVYHAGSVGTDGTLLLDELEKRNIDPSFIKISSQKTGHAIIQVNSIGQNCILLHGGANQDIDEDYINQVMKYFNEGDYLLIQNEINNIPYIMECARKNNMKIVLNPSPVSKKLLSYPLELVDIFVLNKVEGTQLTDEVDEVKIVNVLLNRYPHASILLTLGSEGALFKNKEVTLRQEIYKTEIKDTTGAGDTFTGFFLGSITQGMSIKDSLRRASLSASIAISREGAVPSIPILAEVIAKENSI